MNHVLIALLLPFALQTPPATPVPAIPFDVPCSVDASLDCLGGPIAFTLDVRAPRGKGGTPTFALVNGGRGEDVTWIERWEKGPTSLLLDIDSYDSHLEILSVDHGKVFGKWRKLRAAGEWTTMDVRGVVRPSTPASADSLPEGPAIDGRWAVQFSTTKDPAVGVFTHPSPGKIAGTFLTTLGDYRYLSGKFDTSSHTWRMSCFDGAHAFLVIAKPADDGSLTGEFWSGDKWNETWTAKRDHQAALPDPFGLTKAASGVDLAKLVFTAADGSKVSLADPAFAGKGRIVQLFGTWCPNCNDEADYLRALDSRYRASGLTIVGLAFELTGDAARDQKQVELFRKRHGTTYPLLLAGTSDKAEASKAFPLLDQVRAFPTTIFLRGDGTVLAVHQGYSGPATGDAHQKLRADFERLIADLLGLKKPGAR